MLRKFEQQLPPTFQLSKTQNLNLSLYQKLRSLAIYNITLKSYCNKISQLAMKSLISIFLQFDDAVDVTSRHVMSHPRTLRRVDVVDVVDTSWRHCVDVMNIFLRLIDQKSIRGSQNFNKLKSAFKLRLSSPGRKLLPIVSTSQMCLLVCNYNLKNTHFSIT